MDTLQKKILCPSILNLSTDNMREEIEKLDATDMDIYHVDIMDGTFVPNFGMSVRELEMIRRITDAGHHKLVDCHMMVMNPHRYIKRIAEAGADIIYIHPESELIPSATLDGIFQEYVVMPRSQVYEYDASKMTYQQAALCEPFTIGLQANWRGDVRPGDVVLVHGGGPIGLIVANIAKSRGATVIVSEPNESRLAMAKDFGADYSINPMKEDLDAFINKLTDGEGVNVIFEAAGIPALLAHATSQLSPAGRLVAMTFGKEPIPVNFKEINAKELTILGTRHQYQKFPEVVKILPDHLKEVDEITTHVFKAEDFQKAFDTLADRNSGAGKVVLTFA